MEDCKDAAISQNLYNACPLLRFLHVLHRFVGNDLSVTEMTE